MRPYVYLLKNTSEQNLQYIRHRLADGTDAVSAFRTELPEMAHCTFARFYDEVSLNALIKAIRAGIFGRGSVGRFHVLLVGPESAHLVPLFRKGRYMGWVDDRECVMGLMAGHHYDVGDRPQLPQ